MADQIFPKQNFAPDNNQCDPLYSSNRLERLIALDTNCTEAIFPFIELTWEHAKTQDGKPFIHLRQQIVWQEKEKWQH